MNTVKFENVTKEALAKQLLTNTAGLRYGAVSLSLKLEDGMVVEFSHSRTEHTRDLEFIDE